jgi:hypothetical protein
MRSFCVSMQFGRDGTRPHLFSVRLEEHLTKCSGSRCRQIHRRHLATAAHAEPPEPALAETGHVGVGRQRRLAAEVRVQHP